jgi:hypothetical protein
MPLYAWLCRSIEDANDDVNKAGKRDLELMAQVLEQGSWEALSREERASLQLLYEKHGLDLQQLLSNARKQVRRGWQQQRLADLMSPMTEVQLGNRVSRQALERHAA